MMRWLGSTLVALVVIAGCGGKVVADGANANGGSATSSSSSGTTSSAGLCSVGECGTPSDASCTCTATCNEQLLEVDCLNGACTCLENGIKIFNCTQLLPGDCGVTSGCCAEAFFGGNG